MSGNYGKRRDWSLLRGERRKKDFTPEEEALMLLPAERFSRQLSTMERNQAERMKKGRKTLLNRQSAAASAIRKREREDRLQKDHARLSNEVGFYRSISSALGKSVESHRLFGDHLIESSRLILVAGAYHAAHSLSK